MKRQPAIRFLIAAVVSSGAVVIPDNLSASLDPAVYMAKISERLTGSWPTAPEYEELAHEMEATKCNRISCLDSFFTKYIAGKLSTPAFYSEAVLKVFERFSFQTPERPPFPMLSYSTGGQNARMSEELLVYWVMQANRPLDDLYASQRVFEVTPQGYGPDSLRYINWPIEALRSSKVSSLRPGTYPELDGQDVRIIDYSGHPNVAGLFSLRRFLTRYWNTPVNENRKRAAAVFRVMFCDSMSPALERTTMREREEALARGIPDVALSSRSLEEIHRNRHAAQTDCAACHTRLDPVARSMRPLELGVSLMPVAGRLRLNSGAIDIAGASFSDLVRKGVRLAKYSDCQMRWLVNWIIGRDADIHPARFTELVSEFDRSQRRAKTAIAMLLRSPEFMNESVPIVEPPSFKKAKDVLVNCEECHIPITGMRGDELRQRLFRIADRLDLAHNGASRTMPPSDHYWSPSEEELRRVKEWLGEGAPLQAGRPPLFSPTEVSRMFSEPALPSRQGDRRNR